MVWSVCGQKKRMLRQHAAYSIQETLHFLTSTFTGGWFIIKTAQGDHDHLCIPFLISSSHTQIQWIVNNIKTCVKNQL